MRPYLRLLVGPAILGLILWKLDFSALLSAISGLSVGRLCAAAAISLLGTVVSALRWRIFIPEFAFAPLLRLSFISQLYAVLLPGQLAGEAVKAYRISKGQVRKPRLVASVVVDRVIGTLALLLLGLIGLWLSPRGFAPGVGVSFTLLLAALIVILFALRVPAIGHAMERACGRMGTRGPRHARAADAMVQFVRVWREFVEDPWRLTVALAVGLFFQGLAASIFVLLAHDLGINVAVPDWLWIVAVVSLAVIVPASVAGIGLRDGALIGTLGYLGVASERAIALSLVLFGLTLFGALMGWLVEVGTTEATAAAGSKDRKNS